MEKLFKRNNNGKPCYWQANLDVQDSVQYIVCRYGVVGGKEQKTGYKVTQKNGYNELMSRYKAKKDAGYLDLDEIRDDSVNSKGRPPVEDGDVLYRYLDAYLPKNLTNNNTGAILPMLAKTYNGNIFNKIPTLIGQPKINGLRCLIKAYSTNNLFKPYGLIFQSREGKYWNSLSDLEDCLIAELGNNKLRLMVDDNIVLDGELYLPNYTINDINHFVKDPNCKENKRIQFWCYDLAIDDIPNNTRNRIRSNFIKYKANVIDNISNHYNNTNRLIYVDEYTVQNNEQAIAFRDMFINNGFEGLILRNPDAIYQFGRRRANYMEKFKSSTDGKFEIIDAVLDKRGLPVFTCKNDINNATFECRLGGNFEYQKEFYNKGQYIGRKLFIEFSERSGIDRVPFHQQKVELIPE